MIFNFLQTKDRRGLNYSKIHKVAISLHSEQTPKILGAALSSSSESDVKTFQALLDIKNSLTL